MMPLPYSVSEDFTIFAFDDRTIPFTRNLKLEMNTPQKHPDNPLLARVESGTPDCLGVQFYGSIVKDGDLYRMWYVALDEELQNWPGPDHRVIRQAYAESDDGVNWRRPVLGLVEYKGNKENNLIKISPTAMGMLNLKVIMEPDDPDPQKRFKMSGQTWWHSDEGFGQGTLITLFSEFLFLPIRRGIHSFGKEE